MIKHIGRHNDKRVVILYRTVPGEPHMCLVVYSDLLPRLIHDDIMKALESTAGQQASEFADALFRHTMADGRNALQTLHVEKFIKKVPTNQIVVTPSGNSTVRLDELNSILEKMQSGEEAVKKLAELDRNSGLRAGQNTQANLMPENTTPLTDEEIVASLRKQAEKARETAQSMIAEAERLEQEAAALNADALKLKTKNGNKKTKTAVESVESESA